MEKHRNLSYLEQLLEDINRAEQDRFEVRKFNVLMHNLVLYRCASVVPRRVWSSHGSTKQQPS